MSLSLLIENFSGKNRVINSFNALAQGVVETNNLPADPARILFLMDDQSERQARTASDITYIPAIWSDVIFQLTRKRFEFCVKFIGCNLENTSQNTFMALMYHEMRHIKKDAKTGALYLDKHHDIEDWSELVQFGDWENTPSKDLPNLAETKIEREGNENGGKSLGAYCGVGVSGNSSGVLALTARTGIETVEERDRGLKALPSVQN